MSCSDLPMTVVAELVLLLMRALYRSGHITQEQIAEAFERADAADADWQQALEDGS